MLDQALSEFNLKPDIELSVMRPSQSLADLSAQLYSAVDDVLVQQDPDWVVVQGDTTTVMVASLCAFYRGVKVAHVEAGLRTFDKLALFSEEVNRRIVTLVADLHFAPTKNAKDNLLREDVPASSVIVTGNTVVDAWYWMQASIAGNPLRTFSCSGKGDSTEAKDRTDNGPSQGDFREWLERNRLCDKGPCR